MDPTDALDKESHTTSNCKLQKPERCREINPETQGSSVFGAPFFLNVFKSLEVVWTRLPGVSLVRLPRKQKKATECLPLGATAGPTEAP